MNEPAMPNASVAAELSSIVLEQADRLFRGIVTSERMADADRCLWPAQIWNAVEQAGLPLALVSEAHGGVGLPAVDALRVIRRSAYYTLPVPLAETMLAQMLWTQAGGEPLQGCVSLAPVRSDESIRIQRSARGCTVSGSARRVPWGGQADHVLLCTQDESDAGWLALLPRGSAALESFRNIANEPRDTLVLDAVALNDSNVRRAPTLERDALLTLGAAVRAQQMVGAMERCIDYAVSYATERQQFGRAIGKFQAIQHMLADAAGQYAAGAAAADLAAAAFATPEFSFAAAIAKSRVGEAAGNVAAICHQVHGAMGFTHEHPLHFATRRLWSWRDEFGSETYWQTRIGQLICARGADALWATLVGE